MIGLIFAGITIGIAAGIKPGPLGIYVIHQTMSKGVRHGFFASLAPLITDGPVVLIALFVTQELKDIGWLISSISFAGAIYLLVIAARVYKTSPTTELNPPSDGGSSSFFSAITLNILNPAPYVFWFSIGSAFISEASALGAWVFALCLTGAICLTKFAVALAVKMLGHQLNPKAYGAILKLLALPLILFSVHLFYNGINIWLT